VELEARGSGMKFDRSLDSISIWESRVWIRVSGANLPWLVCWIRVWAWESASSHFLEIWVRSDPAESWVWASEVFFGSGGSAPSEKCLRGVRM
jgi:hypothetical protein